MNMANRGADDIIGDQRKITTAALIFSLLVVYRPPREQGYGSNCGTSWFELVARASILGSVYTYVGKLIHAYAVCIHLCILSSITFL